MNAPDPHEGGYCASLTVPGRVASIRVASGFIVAVARSLQIPLASGPLFEVAIVEALTNAVTHGTPARPDASIRCELETIGRRFIVRIFDEGPGFVPVAPVPLPEWIAGDSASIPASGHGLHIIRSVFPELRTVTSRDGFGVEMALTF
jgi:anti-sigma regulatory factor (Ser/Thr protein kinase)